MPQIEQKIMINRPVGEIFRYVVDFRNDPEWQDDVVSVHQTDGMTRVGTMLTESRDMHVLGWRLDLNADVIDYQPNKMLEYKGVMGRFPVEGRYEFNFSGGSTEFVHRMDIRMGFLFGLFSPLLSGALNRRTRNTLENLKQRLEA